MRTFNQGNSRGGKGAKGAKGPHKGKKKGRPMSRPRVCRFCADKALRIDYKEGKALSPFISERGRIVPRRISGNCAKHQREITLAVKRARIIAMIPFTATQLPLV